VCNTWCESNPASSQGDANIMLQHDHKMEFKHCFEGSITISEQKQQGGRDESLRTKDRKDRGRGSSSM